MILLKKHDMVITVALSTHDMLHTPKEIRLENLQTKEVTTHNITDISTGERTGLYQFYVVGTAPVPPLTNTTILKLPDGTYNYTVGEEIGLLQIGVPTLDKTEYTSVNQNVVYNG